ncbi:hypothetical protein GCM10028822_40960 [Hymenobacter terrigena]
MGLLAGMVTSVQAQPGQPVALGTAKAPVSAAAPGQQPAVLTYADEMPVFPGGDVAFHKYLAEKINYPADAQRRNLSGTVYVRFVVDEEGRIRDAEVAKGCGNGFDEEALRLVRLMPWWSPGRMGGQPVRVMRTLPILFRVRH